MIYRLLILLLLTCRAVANIGCLVGGTNSANTNAGWFDSDAVAVADTFAANGGPVASGTGTTQNDGGDVQINDNGNFGLTSVGMYIYVNFTDVYVDGRYLIIATDSESLATLNLAYTSDGSVTAFNIGGAVPIVDGTFDLQDVLDDALGSAGGNNVDIYVAGSDTVAATIVADTGGGAATGTLKRIIGTNTSYVADGTYATITADTVNLAGTPIIQVDDISYITFENIHVVVSGDPATAGEDGFQIANGTTQTRVSFINCESTDAYIGFNDAGDIVNRVNVGRKIDCTVTGSVSYGMLVANQNGLIDRCFIEVGATNGMFVRTTTSITIQNCIIDGGTNGIFFQESLPGATVSGCSFYNQTVACIGANIAKDILLDAYNNLFWVATIGADYPILNAAGVISMNYEDYNFTNADATRASMLTGANSGNTLWSDTETNLWTDAANNDFTVVDASMIDGGMPTLSDEGGTPADGYSTPGAAQLAQTQAGGGGQPVLGGSIVR